MDYHNGREILEWNEEDYCISEETNPVSTEKNSQQRNEKFLQVKRRRMFHFENEALDSPFYDTDMPSIFLKTKDREDLLKEALTDMTPWDSSFSEDLPGYGEMDQSLEGWLDNCLHNYEMNNNPIDVNLAVKSDAQIDISGTKSYAQTRAKIATSIAYPFDIIKPSGYYGDTTLQEINERIHSPLSSKLKNNNDPFATSAFSGKPVVGKTTIHMEGGRGSITIMKIKG